MFRNCGMIVGIAFYCSAAFLPVAQAARMAENFNDYGSSDRTGLANAPALNGGSGWGSAYQFDSARTDMGPGYEAGQNLQFSNPGYVNTENESGADDGRAMAALNDSYDVPAYRTFPSSLTGTIWISMLARHSTDAGGELRIYLDTIRNGTGSNTYFGLNAGDEMRVSWGGAVSDSSALATAQNNLLILARVQIDVDGANDSLDFWVFRESDNPDLSSALTLDAGAIRAPFSRGGADMFGSGLDLIGIGGGGSGGAGIGYFDALRVSNDPDAFDYVLRGGVVPEPATMSLLVVAGMISTLRRRTGC